MSSDNKTDIEKLLEIAKTPTQVSPQDIKPLSEAHRFALHYEIKPGEYKVRSALIYEMYKNWKNGKNLQTKTKFFSDFAKIFQKFKNSDYIFYMLDPTPFNLDDEAYEKIRDAIKK